MYECYRICFLHFPWLVKLFRGAKAGYSYSDYAKQTDEKKKKKKNQVDGGDVKGRKTDELFRKKKKIVPTLLRDCSEVTLANQG